MTTTALPFASWNLLVPGRRVPGMISKLCTYTEEPAGDQDPGYFFESELGEIWCRTEDRCKGPIAIYEADGLPYRLTRFCGENQEELGIEQEPMIRGEVY